LSRRAAICVVRCVDQGFAVSLAAIRTGHLLAGRSPDLRHPRLAMVVEGVTRAKGTRPRRQAAPAVPGVLRPMLVKRITPSSPIGARERAMLLLGFGAALRRGKTNQHGAGQEILGQPSGIRLLPPYRACRVADASPHRPDLDWTATATTRAERPLFCGVTRAGRVTGDKAVARLVKQARGTPGSSPNATPAIRCAPASPPPPPTRGPPRRADAPDPP
jgi:hypothetical protein